MEVTAQIKISTRKGDASKSKASRRKSLHQSSASKEKFGQGLGNRCHVSEVLKLSTQKFKSAENSQKANASASKSQGKKSNSKGPSKKKSSIKKTEKSKASNSKSKFTRSELNMIRQGEKWVSEHQNVIEVVNMLESSNRIKKEHKENQALNSKSRNNSRASKAESKKKDAKIGEEEEKTKSKSRSKSQTPAKTPGKSLAKNTKSKKGKSPQMKLEINPSELKRNIMASNDLTNEESVRVEQMKSRKKSNIKSKKKE